jgi:cytochrome c556
LWQNSADFQKLMNDMKSKTAALSAAAAKGESFDALKPIFGAAGGSCKACHDKYKAD